jgi:hypothetical protein
MAKRVGHLAAVWRWSASSSYLPPQQEQASRVPGAANADHRSGEGQPLPRRRAAGSRKPRAPRVSRALLPRATRIIHAIAIEDERRGWSALASPNPGTGMAAQTGRARRTASEDRVRPYGMPSTPPRSNDSARDVQRWSRRPQPEPGDERRRDAGGGQGRDRRRRADSRGRGSCRDARPRSCRGCPSHPSPARRSSASRCRATPAS